MSETDTTTIGRVERLVTPILTDLHLELYDLEFRGGTLRITVDTPSGGDKKGVDLETIALATRLISRELDHEDPVPGHYTLEVSSPGLERTLRTPAHFTRSLGATVAVRLRDIEEGGERRIHGTLEAADESSITVRTDQGDERTVPYTHIDRAKTVFVWGPTPKPGQPTKKEKQQR
jgi:ribosome maturation factor RimP